MIDVAEADRLIREHTPAAATIEVSLTEATGEYLREAIRADRPLPPYDRATMDGYALDSTGPREGRRRFRIGGTCRAGDPPAVLSDPSACLEIMTGAVLPAGCDCVVPVEDTRADGSDMVLRGGEVPEPMHFVHRAASDHAAGDVLVPTGTRLGAAEIGTAASVGQTRVRVARRPRVALVGTGDELVAPDQTPEPHQIRASNAYGLEAGLARCGFSAVTRRHAPDNPEMLRRVLSEARDAHEVVLITGGVSRGRYDHVPEVLRHLGVQCVFHRVRQRPGKPLWFGTGPDDRMVFGLPGNPVSALIGLWRYVLPALREHLAGAPGPARFAVLQTPVDAPEGLTLFKPVRVRDAADGRREAAPVRVNTSGDFAALAGTDGFAELPTGGGPRFEAGQTHRLWLWTDGA